jgi:hypothetical protein
VPEWVAIAIIILVVVVRAVQVYYRDKKRRNG